MNRQRIFLLLYLTLAIVALLRSFAMFSVGDPLNGALMIVVFLFCAVQIYRTMPHS